MGSLVAPRVGDPTGDPLERMGHPGESQLRPCQAEELLLRGQKAPAVRCVGCGACLML